MEVYEEKKEEEEEGRFLSRNTILALGLTLTQKASFHLQSRFSFRELKTRIFHTTHDNKMTMV